MNPSPNAASVAIFSGHEVLVIKRAFAPYQNQWTLPGGRLEAGETAADCAQREVLEEMALHVDALIPVTQQTTHDFTIAVFTTRMRSGVPTPSDEVSDWCWAASERLHQLKTTPGLHAIIAQAEKLVTGR